MDRKQSYQCQRVSSNIFFTKVENKELKRWSSSYLLEFLQLQMAETEEINHIIV